MKKYIHNSYSKFRKGFTLVEVLVVALIIAVLASVAVTTAFNARKGAAESTISSIVTDVNKAIQRAALLPADEAIPAPTVTTDNSPGESIKLVIATLAFTGTGDLGSATDPYDVSYSAPTGNGVGANAKPLFTMDSAKKMIDLINQHIQSNGSSAEGDRKIKYDLGVRNDSTGGWGGIQFYLKPNSNN